MELTIIDDLRARHLVPVEHVAFSRASDERIGPVEAAYLQVKAAAEGGWFGEGVSVATVEDIDAATALKLSEQIVERYKEAIGIGPN